MTAPLRLYTEDLADAAALRQTADPDAAARGLREVQADVYSGRRAPRDASPDLAGTPDRARTLEARAESRESLTHPDDRADDDDRGIIDAEVEAGRPGRGSNCCPLFAMREVDERQWRAAQARREARWLTDGPSARMDAIARSYLVPGSTEHRARLVREGRTLPPDVAAERKVA